MKYSIIVPVYKEAKNISRLIAEVNTVLKKNKIKYELLFVDDDSRDDSLKIFKKSKNKNTKFYVRNQKPRDLSRSVVYGFEKSNNDNLIVMDGDLQHNPKDLLKLIKIYKNSKCDLVIGSRRLENYKIANLNPLRFFFSKILNMFFNLLFNKKINDPMSGFFLLKKKIYKKCKKNLTLLGYKILIDIVLSSKSSLNIKEVFINFKIRDKGFSKMRPKILFQLLLFLLIKFIKHEKKNK